MEVRVNTKRKILRSFLGWLPLALVSAAFYGVIFVLVVMWLLTNYAGVAENQARQIGWVVGGAFLVFGSYAYLNWLTSSLSSYRLFIENDDLFVRGKAGWKTLDIKIPINSIQKIYIGQSATTLEKVSSGHGAIQDQVSSSLTFFPVSGKSFKLDFAAKAFDNESLYGFLVFLKNKGVETNVNA